MRELGERNGRLTYLSQFEYSSGASALLQAIAILPNRVERYSTAQCCNYVKSFDTLIFSLNSQEAGYAAGRAANVLNRGVRLTKLTNSVPQI
jgi:hypothetical protein